MDETKYINHKTSNISTVEETDHLGDDKIKFHEVYIKQEPSYPDDNVTDTQENSTFLKNDEKDLYENLICKNEVTCESEQITPSVLNLKDESLTINRHCKKCGEPYDIFCNKCSMLLHILDNCTARNDIDRARKTLPKYILNIRQSDDRTEGVFARRTIPKGVYFGPFDGLEATPQKVEYIWKLKCGKFVNAENDVNWMCYVNSAKRLDDRNLIIFQSNGNLYYRTDREINAGEELLIYYDREIKLNNETEQYCYPLIQKEMCDVYACTFCCLGFSAKDYLVDHKIDCPFVLNQEISEEEIIQCPYCKIYLDKSEYLEFHLSYCYEMHKRKLPTNLKVDVPRAYPYRCEICKKGFLHKYSLNKHNCTKKKDEVFQCPLCVCKYRSRRGLTLHINLNHATSPVEKYKCSTCNFETKYKSNLKNHVVTHSKRSYECEKCGSRFCRKYNLKAHKCGDKKLYDCETCGKTFQREKNLKLHSNMHRDVTFNCKVCGKDFKQRRQLTKHNIVHRR